MTPEFLSILRATPGSRSGHAQRVAAIAATVGMDAFAAVRPALDTLAVMGLVDTIKVPRDLLFFRTTQGDRVATGGEA